jgi:group I intron endonuclease
MAVKIQPFSTKFKGKCGLYKITIADKYYYGSSNNLYNRYYQHLPELRWGKHKNRYLQGAYNKHNDFRFDVLCICEPNQRRELEQQLLSTCFGDRNCMNLTLRTEGPSGIVWTKDAREKQSKTMMGNQNGRYAKGIKKQWSPDAKEHVRQCRSKRFIAIDPNGVSTTFLGYQELCGTFGVPARTIFSWIKYPLTPRRKFKDWVFINDGGGISFR